MQMPPVKECALSHSIDVYQPLSLRKGDDAAESMEILKRLAPDCIVVVAYGQILPKEVLELHGSVLRNYCMRCRKPYPVEAIAKGTGIPKCSCGGIIKPDVVLYEEGLDSYTINKSVEYISKADILIIGGTSLAVYPAAGLIDYYRGNKLVLVNKSPTPADRRADLVIHAPIGEVFSQL